MSASDPVYDAPVYNDPVYSDTVYSEPIYRSSGGFIKNRKDAVLFDYLTFGIFTLSFIGSATALGIGVWTIVDRDFHSIILGQETMTASAWLLALAGLIGLVNSVYGLVVCNMQAEKATFVFCGIHTLVEVMLIGCFILAIVYKSHINKHPERIEQDMMDTIRYDYGVNLDNSWNRRITDAYDETQEKLYCCSVRDESWRNYLNSEWYLIQPPDPEMFIRPYVPESCCVKNMDGTYVDKNKCQTYQYGPPGYPNLDGNNEGLHYRGCFLPAKERGNEMTDFMIGTSICVGVLTILPALLYGFYMAMYGIPALIRLDEKYLKDRQSMVSAGGAFADMYGYT